MKLTTRVARMCYRINCCCPVAKWCPTLCNPWTVAHQASLSFTISWSLLKLMSIESVMLSIHLILCRLLLSCPQSFLASGSFPVSQLFTSGGQSIGVSASASLISLRMDWLDLLAVQGTLKSLLQHHSSKASILWCSAFFMVQLSHPYMTTGKTTLLLLSHFSHVRLCVTPWTAAHQAPLSMGFYWSGVAIACFDDMDLCQESDVSAF